MRGWRGYGVLELLLVLALTSVLSAGLWYLARAFTRPQQPDFSFTPTAETTAKLQLLRLQAQQLQLLEAQQGASQGEQP